MGLTLSSDKTYITYLSWERIRGPFNKDKIVIDLERDDGNKKPWSAFWGSPENAKYGWKDYCDEYNYDAGYDFNNPIKWKLKEGSKIYEVDKDDVYGDRFAEFKKYVNMEYIAKYDYTSCHGIDFNKMANDGIVAMELLDSDIGHFCKNSFEWEFSTWSCESIVVFDPSKIVFL